MTKALKYLLPIVLINIYNWINFTEIIELVNEQSFKIYETYDSYKLNLTLSLILLVVILVIIQFKTLVYDRKYIVNKIGYGIILLIVSLILMYGINITRLNNIITLEIQNLTFIKEISFMNMEWSLFGLSFIILYLWLISWRYFIRNWLVSQIVGIVGAMGCVGIIANFFPRLYQCLMKVLLNEISFFSLDYLYPSSLIYFLVIIFLEIFLIIGATIEPSVENEYIIPNKLLRKFLVVAGAVGNFIVTIFFGFYYFLLIILLLVPLALVILGIMHFYKLRNRKFPVELIKIPLVLVTQLTSIIFPHILTIIFNTVIMFNVIKFFCNKKLSEEFLVANNKF
ncbi:MAG: hypothetical protein ATN36_05885 [Epulopiscium sp. Nele67-Bin005]|nr:MAG: hypothetical protein ATN36_05885 [Epulopiscium sp. Nele67-Bin005]